MKNLHGPSTVFADEMLTHGFSVWDLGGHLQAYGRNIDDVRWLQIDLADGSDTDSGILPSSMADPVVVCLMDIDNEEPVEARTWSSLTKFLLVFKELYGLE